MMSLRNLTPRSIEPSVTPVAENRQSPRTMSSIWYFLRGSRIPILAARSRFSSVSRIRRLCIWPPMQRSAAAADVDVDAGLVGRRRMDHPGHVAVGDQAHRGLGLAQRDDEIGVARPVE